MKLKLTPFAMFAILLLALICCNLFVGGIREPLENPDQYTGPNADSAEPLGVSQDQIPAGDEDLYILKSQVVPPVCPACPTVSGCDKEKECPPCPPCGRCPETAFECKKVPNYNAVESDSLPRAVLSDFSTFAM